MEYTVISSARLKIKNKWVYTAHSKSLRSIEEAIERSVFSVVNFGSLTINIADGLHGVRNYVNDGIVMLAVGNITEYGLDSSEKKMVTTEEHQRLKRSQVQKGDLLITITGRLGTGLVYNSDEPANLSAHVARAKINENAVNPYYLAAYFNSVVGKQQVEEFSVGSLYPHINVNRLQNVRVILPPRPMQDHIAQVMQDAYATRRAQLAEAEQISSQINDYILQQLNVNLATVEQKRTALKPISAIAGKRFDFEAVVTMSELKLSLTHATTLRDVVSQANERILPVESCPEDDIHYIGLADIESHTGELVNFTPTRGRQILSSSPIFQEGDILFGRMRPYLNKAWLATFDGVCSGEAIVLRPDKQKIDPVFLHALLLSRITLDQVVPLQSGTSLPRVAASDVLNINLPVPDDLQQQKEIGAEITRRRAAARRLRAEAETVVAEAKARVERMILGEEAP